MKKFRVTASFSTSCTVEILAKNENEAFLIAEGMDGGQFEPCGSDSWEIDKVEELPDNLKPAELAFIEAYGTACAEEGPETVRAFFLMYDDADAFCDMFGTCAYSSIMDAFQVWQLAIKYQRGIEKIN